MYNLTLNEDNPDADPRIQAAIIRVQLAQAFTSLHAVAFDALLTHGINYRLLPEYLDVSLIEEGNKLNIVDGQEKLFEWMRRVEHGIKAAIRRKGMRLT